MKRKNRETIERAIGIIEGLSWAAEGKKSEALTDVCEILDAVMRDEVEVVSCKDCEYSKLLRDNENEKHIFRHCRIMNAFETDYSFSSYGKLQKDEVKCVSVEDVIALKGGAE